MDKVRLLAIDDEIAVLRFLRAGLLDSEYELLEAETGTAGLKSAATKQPDAILLDLGLPDMDGLEVLKDLRQWTQTPVIVLSARGQERDKIEALDSGADDYLTKPFGIGELLARIRAALRHSEKNKTDVPSCFEYESLKIDLAARQVFVEGQEIHLTPNEFKLLALLVRNAGKVVTHRQLLAEVWGDAYIDESHYLRVYMGQLRHKLEQDPANPKYLTTEPGVGYRLRVF